MRRMIRICYVKGHKNLRCNSATGTLLMFMTQFCKCVISAGGWFRNKSNIFMFTDVSEMKSKLRKGVTMRVSLWFSYGGTFLMSFNILCSKNDHFL